MLSFDEYREKVNAGLTGLLPDLPPESAVLREAMQYSLETGGKRLRPVLLMASCEAAGSSADEALPYALAIEYIHTYSLIHDDLPAMDNDDLRRGRPTNHRVYGEDIAILAGDALLSAAAEAVTGEPLKYADRPEKMAAHIGAAHEIMKGAGASGMVAGQTADVTSAGRKADASLVNYIEIHKTADLITAAVRAGLMLAGAAVDMLESFTEYAVNLGTAFQILDDILDYEGDAAIIGKTPGKDLSEDRCNYVSVHGMDAAKSELHRLTLKAVEAVSPYGDCASFFITLAETLENRSN